MAVNCAALPDTLLESELFGYRKGAFSEAKKDKPGRFARAAGGTLFLDEIGDISTALQVKLLRVLQEKEYEPLGATSTLKTDARIIASTNRTLSELVARGSFREDLFYRLNVIKIELPPLASRREDIPLLIQNFIRKFNALKGKEIKGISDQALNILMQYNFPGNIRELENVIEYAFVLCRGDMIKTRHLSRDLRNGIVKGAAGESPILRAPPTRTGRKRCHRYSPREPLGSPGQDRSIPENRQVDAVAKNEKIRHRMNRKRLFRLQTPKKYIVIHDLFLAQ